VCTKIIIFALILPNFNHCLEKYLSKYKFFLNIYGGSDFYFRKIADLIVKIFPKEEKVLYIMYNSILSLYGVHF